VIGKLLSSAVYRTGFVALVTSGVLMVIMGFLVFQGVIRRYVFENAEPYSYEYTCYFLLASMLFATIHITSLGQHIRVDLFFGRFPKRVQYFSENLIHNVLGLIFCAVVTWKSWEIAWRSLETNKVSTWGTPIFVVQMVVPVSTGLVCLVLICKITAYLASKRSRAGKPGNSS
jgi:C4-dicarboxylate transporter DctQ subunit